jgi:hypothetical protein
MAANNKVIHGARCVVLVNGLPVGVFTSVSYGVNYSHQPIYILGRSGAAEIAMTGMDVVSVQAHGWRVLDHGPFAGKGTNNTSGTPVGQSDSQSTGDVGMPKLQDLLTQGAISIAIVDKLASSGSGGGASNDGKVTMQVDQCRVVNFQSQINSRQAQDFSVTFVGISYSDEAGAQNEPSWSINLPS